MRIAVISVFPPADIPDAEHAYRISVQMAQQGNEVHVLTQRGAAVPVQEGLLLHPVMEHWSWTELPRLLRELGKIKPDAVLLIYVGHLYGGRAMITILPTLVKHMGRRVRFVTQFEHPRGAVEGAGRSRGARTFRHALQLVLGKGAGQEHGTLLRDSDSVVVLSSHHVAYLKNAYADVEKKTTLIPPPVLMRVTPEDTGEMRSRQRAALGIEQDAVVAVYLGYIYIGKGLETLLTAFEQVCRQHKNVHLVIVGGTLAPSSNPMPGYAEHIALQAKQLFCADNVHFTGGFDTESDQASRFLRAADFAVLPFDSGVQLNNSSVAGVTAHRLPVVTTQGPGLEPAFRNRENVLLCPPQDAACLAEAMIELVQNTDLRRNLASGASRLNQDWYSWSSAISKLHIVLSGKTNT